MTTIIRHVRHRVGLPIPSDRRLFTTRCGVLFTPYGHERDFAVHRPAEGRCQECYR